MSEVFEDVACAACGCVCDDLRITVREGRIVQAEGACFLSEAWLASAEGSPDAADIEGHSVGMDEAAKHAAQLLQAARSPLIYGLSRSSTKGQRAAVRLADQLRATIDTTASLCHGPSIMAIQEVGESTSSLGEIKNRSDLVIFWGADPSLSHPRHAERYSVDPVGMFVPNGRKDRTIVVVDSQPNTSAEWADVVVKINPGQDLEAIWTLRCLLRGWLPETGSTIGAELTVLQNLAERMRGCRSGVVFFGLGLTRQGAGHRNVEALLRLVTDLNAHTRFYAKRMRIPGDVTGADSVLCWQTGFPFSVSLTRGYPRYNPGEYSANELLERKEVDACLLVGSEGIADFSAAALEHLRTIPTITLDYPAVRSLIEPTVRFTTAVYGIHVGGTAYRMDEVPIPLSAVLPRKYPTDDEVLNAIAKHAQSAAEPAQSSAPKG